MRNQLVNSNTDSNSEPSLEDLTQELLASLAENPSSLDAFSANPSAPVAPPEAPKVEPTSSDDGEQIDEADSFEDEVEHQENDDEFEANSVDSELEEEEIEHDQQFDSEEEEEFEYEEEEEQQEEVEESEEDEELSPQELLEAARESAPSEKKFRTNFNGEHEEYALKVLRKTPKWKDAPLKDVLRQAEIDFNIASEDDSVDSDSDLDATEEIEEPPVSISDLETQLEDLYVQEDVLENERADFEVEGEEYLSRRAEIRKQRFQLRNQIDQAAAQEEASYYEREDMFNASKQRVADRSPWFTNEDSFERQQFNEIIEVWEKAENPILNDPTYPEKAEKLANKVLGRQPQRKAAKTTKGKVPRDNRPKPQSQKRSKKRVLSSAASGGSRSDAANNSVLGNVDVDNASLEELYGALKLKNPVV